MMFLVCGHSVMLLVCGHTVMFLVCGHTVMFLFVLLCCRLNFTDALQAAVPGPQSVNFLQMHRIG